MKRCSTSSEVRMVQIKRKILLPLIRSYVFLKTDNTGDENTEK
jgi:hypothetical protein